MSAKKKFGAREKKLATALDINERLNQERSNLDQSYVMVPIEKYCQENGIKESWMYQRNPGLNDCLVDISNNLDLIAALKVGNVRLKFAHFNLPKPGEKFQSISDPNTGYWINGHHNSYEGYSHLELGPNGLEVAIQRARFFEEFSNSNIQKLWVRMEKEIHPTFFVHNRDNSKVVCAAIYNGAINVIEPVSALMRQTKHTIIKYKGNGVMKYDALHIPLYEVSRNPKLKKKHEEEFEELTPEYVKRTLNKAIRNTLKK
jgi:hypothetical protein